MTEGDVGGAFDLKMARVADFAPALGGRAGIQAYGVGSAGELLAVTRQSTESGTVTSGGGAVFSKTRLADAPKYRVAVMDGGGWRTLETDAGHIMVHYVQPWPGGVLLVGARCRWRPEGPELNAIAVSWDGRPLAQFCLGDGIADLRTVGDRIWVAYNDEGVFGNYGWGGPGPPPIGRAGLVQVDMDGAVVHEFEEARTDIADCYAMNATGRDSVWVHYYTDFPLIHLDNGEYRSWDASEAGGAHSLVVNGDRVAFVGGYRDPTRVRSYERSGQTLRFLGEGRVRRFAWRAAPRTTRFFGVGPDLYGFAGGRAFHARFGG